MTYAPIPPSGLSMRGPWGVAPASIDGTLVVVVLAVLVVSLAIIAAGALLARVAHKKHRRETRRIPVRLRTHAP